ncbi:MAG: helix-turn-helix transcriptional regulator [Candidatus Sabulitectum sp.]|nr:helix-turn-helix transcriptional regulator [Candidatus Sabulitectum sp.]
MKNNIRRLRLKHSEMTQQKLVDLARVTRQTIAALESFRYNPSLVLAMRIAKVFGVSVEDVFDLDE